MKKIFLHLIYFISVSFGKKIINKSEMWFFLPKAFIWFKSCNHIKESRKSLWIEESIIESFKSHLVKVHKSIEICDNMIAKLWVKIKNNKIEWKSGETAVTDTKVDNPICTHLIQKEVITEVHLLSGFIFYSYGCSE